MTYVGSEKISPLFEINGDTVLIVDNHKNELTDVLGMVYDVRRFWNKSFV